LRAAADTSNAQLHGPPLLNRRLCVAHVFSTLPGPPVGARYLLGEQMCAFAAFNGESPIDSFALLHQLHHGAPRGEGAMLHDARQ